MSLTCERCGFPASTLNKLIKHLKDEVQCRPLKSRISHADLLLKLRPPPSKESLTCLHCQSVYKSVGGLKLHLRSCKAKDTELPNIDADITVECNEENKSHEKKDTTRKHIYIHKNMTSHKNLHAFTKDIECSALNISEVTYIECCQALSRGVVDLFAMLHNIPEHENIKWYNDKLIVFDGKGWTEASGMVDDLVIKHLGNIFSILEEKWCDYQMNLRCGVVADEDILPDEDIARIEEFLYNTIVDDDSVYFHCKEQLNEYLETLKSI